MSRRHKRGRSDIRGSHLAGVTERDRAAKVYKQQAEDKRETEAMQSNVVQITKTAAPPQPQRKARQGVYLTQEQHQWLEALLSREGFDRVAEWLEGLPRAKTAQTGARTWSRTALRGIRKTGARHDARGLAVFYELQNNYGKPHRGDDPQIRVVTQERAEPQDGLSYGGGVVQVVDGFDFRLPTLTRAGAEMARVTLSHLADKLGYSNKQQLQRLADRHASELEEFGEIAMVTISVKRGVSNVRVEEPTFSPDQAAYLALSSETVAGRDCRVRILKAYKALLAMFEERLQLHAAAPQVDYQAIATVVGTAVAQAMLPVMQTIKGGFDEMTARRRRDPKPENTEQEHLPYAHKRREALVLIVKSAAGVGPNTPKPEYNDRVRVKWHELYDAMLEQVNVNVRMGFASCVARGEDIEKLDWIERNGHLETAIEIALKLWG